MARNENNTMMLATALDALAVVCGFLVPSTCPSAGPILGFLPSVIFCTGALVGFFAVNFGTSGSVGFILGVGSGCGLGGAPVG